MRHSRILILAAWLSVVGVVAVWTGVALAQAQPMPTMQDLHDMYDAGQYRTCAQQIARALNYKKADAPQQYDRGELLSLRGDCLLNLGDRAGAIKAYTDAQKIGSPDVWCHARAMELLVKGGKYKPKPAPQKSDPDPAAGMQDDAALKQALNDTLAAQRQRVEPELRAAERAQNLKPIIDAVPEMLDLYALERAATGDTADISPRIHQIGDSARTMIARELDQLEIRVRQLEDMANSAVDSGGGGRRGGGGGSRGGGGQWWYGSDVTRRGLFSNERDQLRDTSDYVTKILETAERGQHLARDFNGKPEAWDPLISQSGNLQARITGLLDSN